MTEKILCLIIYLAIVACGVFVIYFKMRHKKPEHFDEMQEKNRAEAYKYAYFTTLLLLVMVAIYEYIVGPIPHYILGGLILAVLMISLLVFGLFCIHNDSFFFIGQDWKKYLIYCTALGTVWVVDFIINLSNLLTKTDITAELANGIISKLVLYGANAVTFLSFSVAICIKMFADRKESEE
jgi:hypothetical protein